MRKSGHYWARTIGDNKNHVVFYVESSDRYYIAGYDNGLKANEFYWISDEMIPEPKQELIPGKYYIVKGTGSPYSDKRIVKYNTSLNGGDYFILFSNIDRGNPENFDVLSEAFDIEDIMKYYRRSV